MRTNRLSKTIDLLKDLENGLNKLNTDEEQKAYDSFFEWLERTTPTSKENEPITPDNVSAFVQKLLKEFNDTNTYKTPTVINTPPTPVAKKAAPEPSNADKFARIDNYFKYLNMIIFCCQETDNDNLLKNKHKQNPNEEDKYTNHLTDLNKIIAENKLITGIITHKVQVNIEKLDLILENFDSLNKLIKANKNIREAYNEIISNELKILTQSHKELESFKQQLSKEAVSEDETSDEMKSQLLKPMSTLTKLNMRITELKAIFENQVTFQDPSFQTFNLLDEITITNNLVIDCLINLKAMYDASAFQSKEPEKFDNYNPIEYEGTEYSISVAPFPTASEKPTLVYTSSRTNINIPNTKLPQNEISILEKLQMQQITTLSPSSTQQGTISPNSNREEEVIHKLTKRQKELIMDPDQVKPGKVKTNKNKFFSMKIFPSKSKKNSNAQKDLQKKFE